MTSIFSLNCKQSKKLGCENYFRVKSFWPNWIKFAKTICENTVPSIIFLQTPRPFSFLLWPSFLWCVHCENTKIRTDVFFIFCFFYHGALTNDAQFQHTLWFYATLHLLQPFYFDTGLVYLECCNSYICNIYFSVGYLPMLTFVC